MKSYKRHFSRFLEADPDRVHFAAHSHHYWPDVTFDAHARAWQDAASLADEKWDRLFSKLWPRAQRHVARLLRLPDPATVAFAPNTHELVMRALSCLEPPVRVLTTDGEFHSFARQLARLEEEGRAKVVRVATRPFSSFADRFTAAARAGFDLVYVSQVFFDSGYALRDLAPLVTQLPKEPAVIIDGYHAFNAIEVDLSALADRVFYVAGGYKYAMSGEGCCFMHAPSGWFKRPIDTGWFAAFFALESGARSGAGVPFADDGSRFLGATFDPSGLYRFDAVMSWLERENVRPADIEAHTKQLQERFVAGLRALPELPLRESQLVVPMSEPNRGQFLAFESAQAKELHERLARDKIVTDVRGDRLRFGFGIYHDPADIDLGVERIASSIGGP